MKKIIKILASCLLILTTAIIPIGCENKKDNEKPKEDSLYEVLPNYKYAFKNLGEKVFPIGAWMAPPYDNIITPIPANYITDSAYKDIADSGINSIYALYDQVNSYAGMSAGNNSKILDAVKFASKYNLNYLARDTNVYSLMEEEEAVEMAKFYSELTKHKGFGGLMAQDEPGISTFNQLKLMRKNFAKTMADYAFYVNMLPSYASTSHILNGAASGGGERASEELYTRYVSEYLRDVKPQFFSYDFYPMMGEFPNIDGGYFKNMSIVREQTANSKVPFWTFIQISSWSKNYVRKCKQEEIDWQVNTSLAYGAKGIQYFTYWTPFDDAGTSPGFYPSQSDEDIGAMVSHDGKKQPAYFKVQKTNSHLKVVGEYLIDAGFAGLIQNGKSPDVIPEKDKITTFRQLESVSGGDAIIGCFDYKGKTMLYVVNNSIVKNDSQISLNFKNQIDTTMIANGQSSNKKSNKIDLSLKAGEGVLLILNNK